MNTSYRIDGMHCAGCTRKVQRSLESMPGITAATVALPDVAIIESSEPIDAREIEKHLQAVGTYSVRLGSASPLRALRPFVPLISMLGIVVLWATLASYPWGVHASHDWMRHFMGGFFILFGMLKLINLPQFAAMFRGYDVVAARVPAWAYIYPFVEVEIGLLYTFGLFPVFASITTVVVMSVGTIGIVQKLRAGGAQTCACLGGFFSVPLTWVTVAENMAMVLMAAWMLFFH